jgi:hypothetical protein
MRGVSKAGTLCYASHPLHEKCSRKMFLEGMGAEGKQRLLGSRADEMAVLSSARSILKIRLIPRWRARLIPPAHGELSLWGLVPFQLFGPNDGPSI